MPRRTAVLCGALSCAVASSTTAAAVTTAAGVVVPPKRYQCVDGFCQPVGPVGGDLARGNALDVCSLTCGHGGAMWPLPRGDNFSLSAGVAPFRGLLPPDFGPAPAGGGVAGMLQRQWRVFQRKAGLTAAGAKGGGGGGGSWAKARTAGVKGALLRVSISVVDPAAPAALLLSTDESYSLSVDAASDGDGVVITAATYYGCRHALETLSQLIATDTADEGQQYIVARATIADKPAFPYRGVMLDVARSFLPLSDLQAVVQAMAASKLNTLHLHLSDTAAFPVHTPRRPNVTAYGAYSQGMSYSQADLADFANFSNFHGVRLVPEIDVPAHAGAGYEWTAEAGLGDVVVCNGDQDSWGTQALEPPSGQLDPTNEGTFAVLGDVYADVADAFPASSLFHLGGDEVVVGCDDRACWPEAGCTPCFAACWNSSAHAPAVGKFLADRGFDVQDPQSFYGLWKNFTVRARGLVGDAFARRAAKGGDTDTSAAAQGTAAASPVPLEKTLQWAGVPTGGSTVTYNLMGQSDLESFLPPAEFVLEVWDNLNGSVAPSLMTRGYDIVLAHTDYVYLDCGQAGWVAPGGYWCEPYHEWYRVYEYLPDARRTWGLSLDPDAADNRVLGSEVLAWAEEIDGGNVQQKLWPRAAALGERFWSDPDPTGSVGWAAADHRMQIHRDRLLRRGFGAAGLQPRWCLQHPGVCTLPADPSADHTATAYRTPGAPHAQTVQAGSALYESDAAGAERRH